MVKRVTSTQKVRLFLAEWRDKCDLTQEQVAERIETTKATISRWEAGQRDPPYAALCALAEVFGVPIARLFIDPSVQSIDAELSALPPEMSKRLIERFNDTIAIARDLGKTAEK